MILNSTKSPYTPKAHSGMTKIRYSTERRNSMSAGEWQTAKAPAVARTQLFRRAIPRPRAFFIHFSSVFNFFFQNWFWDFFSHHVTESNRNVRAALLLSKPSRHARLGFNYHRDVFFGMLLLDEPFLRGDHGLIYLVSRNYARGLKLSVDN